MSKKVVVFGGSGYVGQRVLKALIKQGCGTVVSISRSGAAKSSILSSSEVASITWKKADIFDVDAYKQDLHNCHGVVSTVGAFGSNDFMEKINGDANILCASASKVAGVENFVYVSTVENNLPEFILKGYFHGKKRAEDHILSTLAFPTILRPSFVYGSRAVGPITIPLGLLGRPLETIFSFPFVKSLRDLPGMKAILATPISVDCVGAVAAYAALATPEEKEKILKKIMTVDDMVSLTRSLKLV